MSPLRIEMLEDFLRTQETDFLFLQEVRQPVFDLRGYTAYTNVGTTRRGTAIIAREHLTLTRTICLLSGRGIAATFQGVSLVNICAPSGSEKRREREEFFKLVQRHPTTVIMGVNLIVSSHKQTSRAASISAVP